MPALVTPFDATGDIERSAHRYNIETLGSLGVDGFLIAGSTGEGPYLLAGERRRLVEIARGAAPDAFLICGIAAQSVRQALDQIDELEQADAALVVTPTMFASSTAAQIVFFSAVAASAPCPVWLYTVPGVTQYNLPVEAAIELANHPNIAGIKDSSGMPERIGAMRASCPDDFLIYAGASRALAASAALGADGAITASGNYAFSTVDEIIGSEAGNPEIEPLQERFSALTAAIEKFGIPGTKAAATVGGLRAGQPRLPLSPIAGDDLAQVKTALSDWA